MELFLYPKLGCFFAAGRAGFGFTGVGDIFDVATSWVWASVFMVTTNSVLTAKQLNDRDKNRVSYFCFVFFIKIPPTSVGCQDLLYRVIFLHNFNEEVVWKQVLEASIITWNSKQSIFL